MARELRDFKGLKVQTEHFTSTPQEQGIMTIYKEAITAMRPAIDKILANYQGFNNDYVDEKDMPEREINEFLDRLHIFYPGADKVTLKLAIRQFLTTLGCWHHRVIAKDGFEPKNNRVWNPLEQSLKDFLQQHRGFEISYKENDKPYPAADIISDWIRDNIDESIIKE